eukprot:TRINITY_DN11773_c1_g1_i9.p2 TRINITY_DN11773_c1_g1~~TRINITY_DN11773_c1_g1_i9.p2  ORF type:complete len:159 (+),score=6.90 TRINITY_DN11773_c1_g1_i9:869-1345(+)
MASRLDSNLLTIQGYRELPDTATSTSVGAFLTQIYETTITRAKKNQTFIEKTHSSRYSRSVLRDEHGKQPFGPSVIRQSYGRDFSLARHLRSVQGTSASIHVGRTITIVELLCMSCHACMHRSSGIMIASLHSCSPQPPLFGHDAKAASWLYYSTLSW